MLWSVEDFQTPPLSAREMRPNELPDGLLSIPAKEVFAGAHDPEAALAGLLLLYGHWDLSHKVAQDLETREGSYWHAIIHRIEPDSWNSSYWFRRVGSEHPVFEALCAEVPAILASSTTGWRIKNFWDPQLFVNWCDEARARSEAEKRQVAGQIQRLECERLFAYCRMKTKDLP